MKIGLRSAVLCIDMIKGAFNYSSMRHFFTLIIQIFTAECPISSPKQKNRIAIDGKISRVNLHLER